MDFGALGEAGGDDVFGYPAGGVGGGAVNFRRVFAGERAAAVPRHAAVGVNQYLAPRQARIPHRPPYDEPPGWVDEPARFAVHQLGGDNFLRDFFQVALNAVVAGVRVMLGTHNHRVDALGASVFVLDRHLGFAVGTQIFYLAVLPRRRHALAEAMREGDGQRHELRRLVACVADHHALIARAERLRLVRAGGKLAPRFKGAAHAFRDVH